MSKWVSAMLVVLAPQLIAGETPADMAAAIERDYREHLADLFVELHRNPELSFREFRTAARLAEELRSAGIEVSEKVGGTGVVGMLSNGEGPLVMVRADMDGLPIAESSGLPYASTARQVDITGAEVPVMHACGHDVHVTAMVGTARRLAALREHWSGTVMFVGQPAEERIGGAKAMLADGLYSRFGVPDYALALHVSAGDPAGKISLEPGLIASSSDSVDVTVRGIGAHGASPHQGRDPIYVAAQLVIALQGLVSRELSPLEPGVVTVGSIHGGFKHNIIPDRVELQLTVRADGEATRVKLLDGIERIAEHVGRAAGLPDELLPVVVRSTESTPATVNDPALAARIRRAFVDRLGEQALHDDVREGMGAEDFAYFLGTPDRVPGCYFSVGGTPQADLAAADAGGPPVPSHHSPFFKIEPEPSVTAGVHAMTIAALELLGRRD
ncbi:MAG TPA: amidohydrolase [Candidatus Polarisedimenticolaceae bacterium]|nr:amidohydrolase [Candidatus Polarisedimenticolaceae bacterium]